MLAKVGLAPVLPRTKRCQLAPVLLGRRDPLAARLEATQRLLLLASCGGALNLGDSLLVACSVAEAAWEVGTERGSDERGALLGIFAPTLRFSELLGRSLESAPGGRQTVSGLECGDLVAQVRPGALLDALRHDVP